MRSGTSAAARVSRANKSSPSGAVSGKWSKTSRVPDGPAMFDRNCITARAASSSACSGGTDCGGARSVGPSASSGSRCTSLPQPCKSRWRSSDGRARISRRKASRTGSTARPGAVEAPHRTCSPRALARLSRLLQKPRLADAWLSLEHEQGCPPGHEMLFDHGALPMTTDQGCSGVATRELRAPDGRQILGRRIVSGILGISGRRGGHRGQKAAFRRRNRQRLNQEAARSPRGACVWRSAPGR